jgi:hypothetical protein
MQGKEVRISLEFIVPSDMVLASARKMAASRNEDQRTVGEAVVELTDITRKTMAAVADTVSKETYDLAVYFDYNFGASLEAANRLKASAENEVRPVAESLISQASSISRSKAAFLAAAQKN